MNTRNRIILVVVIAIDIAVFSYGLVKKNQSADAASEILAYKTVFQNVVERKSTLLSEISAAQDSLNKCCKR